MTDQEEVLHRLNLIFDGEQGFPKLGMKDHMKVLMLMRGGVTLKDFWLAIDRFFEVESVRSAFGFICTAALDFAAHRAEILREVNDGEA